MGVRLRAAEPKPLTHIEKVALQLERHIADLMAV